jgi:hypothetical protein
LTGPVERDFDRCAVLPEVPEVTDLATLGSPTDKDDATGPDRFGLRSGRVVGVRAVPDKEGASETTDLAVHVFFRSPEPASFSVVQPSVRRRLAGGRAWPCEAEGVAVSSIALQLGSGGVVSCNHCSISQDAPTSCEPERSFNSSCDCIVEFCRSRAGLMTAT